MSNVMGTLLDHGDEVIVLAPYWVTYPEIIKFCKGVPKIIYTSPFDVFKPSIDEIKKSISPRTKAIIVNSPNNPTGTHYTDEWMGEFAALMKEHPHVNIICDEIYYQLFYFDPKPTYYYQKDPDLLSRTIIVDGISKTLASTGLRLGWLTPDQTLWIPAQPDDTGRDKQVMILGLDYFNSSALFDAATDSKTLDLVQLFLNDENIELFSKGQTFYKEGSVGKLKRASNPKLLHQVRLIFFDFFLPFFSPHFFLIFSLFFF